MSDIDERRCNDNESDEEENHNNINNEESMNDDNDDNTSMNKESMEINDDIDENEVMYANHLITKLQQDGLLPEQIDKKVLNGLNALTQSKQVEILQAFRLATKGNKDTIRKPCAYLGNIIQRQKEADLANKPIDDLPSKVQEELEDIFNSGRISKDTFQQRCLIHFWKLKEESMLEAVNIFKNSDKSSIKHEEAFFNGVSKRLAELARGRQLGLDPIVKERIDEAIRDGKLQVDDLNQKCLDALSELPKRDALELLESFLSSNLQTVRNMESFFFGVVNRFRKRTARPQQRNNSGDQHRRSKYNDNDRGPRRRRSRYDDRSLSPSSSRYYYDDEDYRRYDKDDRRSPPSSYYRRRENHHHRRPSSSSRYYNNSDDEDEERRPGGSYRRRSTSRRRSRSRSRPRSPVHRPRR